MSWRCKIHDLAYSSRRLTTSSARRQRATTNEKTTAERYRGYVEAADIDERNVMTRSKLADRVRDILWRD
jgi:hypothetical protein